MKPFIITVALAAALFGTALASRAQTPEPPPKTADSTRLFFMPTGRTLPGGSGYFDVISLGIAQFQAGLGDWLSVGAGTPAVVLGGGRPVWVTPKVALARSRRLNAAAGSVQYFAAGSSGGFGYGVVTVTQGAAGVTVGVLQGYGDVPSRARALLFGVEHQRSEHTRILLEASVFRGGGLAIAGVRRVHKRFTSDFGMAVPLGEPGPLVAFPVINFGWRF